MRNKSFFQKTLEARRVSNRPLRGRQLGRVKAAAGPRGPGGAAGAGGGVPGRWEGGRPQEAVRRGTWRVIGAALHNRSTTEGRSARGGGKAAGDWGAVTHTEYDGEESGEGGEKAAVRRLRVRGGGWEGGEVIGAGIHKWSATEKGGAEEGGPAAAQAAGDRSGFAQSESTEGRSARGVERRRVIGAWIHKRSTTEWSTTERRAAGGE